MPAETTKKKTCTCPSDCACWRMDDRPGVVLGCGCTATNHIQPTGCRYLDDVEGWVTRWPGIDGAVMVCLTHGGRAPGEAYDDASTTTPCLDSHPPNKPRPRRGTPRQASAAQKTSNTLLWAAEGLERDGGDGAAVDWLRTLSAHALAGEANPSRPIQPGQVRR